MNSPRDTNRMVDVTLICKDLEFKQRLGPVADIKTGESVRLDNGISITLTDEIPRIGHYESAMIIQLLVSVIAGVTANVIASSLYDIIKGEKPERVRDISIHIGGNIVHEPSPEVIEEAIHKYLKERSDGR